MKSRPLGSTGLTTSQVGLGTWPLSGNDGIGGYGAANPETAEATIRAALQANVRLFDTADVYGNGLAESLLGRVLDDCGVPVIVCTKGGRDLATGTFSADPEFLRRRALESRDRLRRPAIDLYLLHNPPPHLIGVRNLYRPLVGLKSQGVLRHIGISVATPEDAWLAFDRPEVEVIELPYNFAHRAAEDLLVEARQRGVAIIVREPLANGLLTGKYHSPEQFSSDDFRRRLPGHVVAAARDSMRLMERYRRDHETWTDFALRFVLDRPEVSCVVVGSRHPDHIGALVKAGGIASAAATAARENTEIALHR